MSRIKGRDTGPELSLRRNVWALGLRYRLQYRIGRTRPDMVFVGAKLAVFVDGCFWHGCPICYKPPSSRHEYWSSKLRRNFEHDQYVNNNLKDSGYMVIRFWEHEILSDVSGCTLKINEVLA